MDLEELLITEDHHCSSRSQKPFLIAVVALNPINLRFFVFAANLICRAAMSLEVEQSTQVHDTYIVYIGTYSGTKSRGIYAGRLNAVAGTLNPLTLVAEMADPTFLAIHPNHRLLYAVGVKSGLDNKTSGVVSAFDVDRATGNLAFLNQQASGGGGPCHLAVDASGKCVLVANYGSGSVAAFPIQTNGGLGEATTVIQHRGASVDPKRQQKPHAHAVGFDVANHVAFCADLGLDKILVYRFSPAEATLVPNDPPSASVKPGAGPRHFVIDPKGEHLYVVNELNSTITMFNYDSQQGSLTELQTVSTLPNEFVGSNTGAEIVIHPNGRFLYASNRGHDSIAAYAIDKGTGALTLVQHQATLGKTPRSFGIDPTGSFLLAANQDSDTVVVFRIDEKTGRLKPTGQILDVPTPVCVTFLPID